MSMGSSITDGVYTYVYCSLLLDFTSFVEIDCSAELGIQDDLQLFHLLLAFLRAILQRGELCI